MFEVGTLVKIKKKLIKKRPLSQIFCYTGTGKVIPNENWVERDWIRVRWADSGHKWYYRLHQIEPISVFYAETDKKGLVI